MWSIEESTEPISVSFLKWNYSSLNALPFALQTLEHTVYIQYKMRPKNSSRSQFQSSAVLAHLVFSEYRGYFYMNLVHT